MSKRSLHIEINTISLLLNFAGIIFAAFVVDSSGVKYLAEGKSDVEQKDVTGFFWFLYFLKTGALTLNCYGLPSLLQNKHALYKVGYILKSYPAFLFISSIINIKDSVVSYNYLKDVAVIKINDYPVNYFTYIF